MRSPEVKMKFIVDGMLGRLAKWLRILGYDTAYFPHLDDNQLVRLARAEGRLLLTRDRGLARRRGLRCLLIENDHLEEQLGQILAELALTAEHPFSRCPLCNTPLQKVEKPAGDSLGQDAREAGRVSPPDMSSHIPTMLFLRYFEAVAGRFIQYTKISGI